MSTCLNFIADDFLNSMQLVFAVFTGEAWGYLGSRRFLVELDLHSDAVRGLNHGLIEKVLLFFLVNMTAGKYWGDLPCHI